MKRGIFFGQNAVDQNAPDYDGWAGLLHGCVPDARDLAMFFGALGYECEARLSGWNVAGPRNPWEMSGQCTRDAWRAVHHDLAAVSQPGDTIVLGNSGHGYQYDTYFVHNGGQGMCFFDGMITDTEQHGLMKLWRLGVNVIYILDTCFSGGMDREFQPFTPRVMPASRKPPVPIERPDLKGSDINANILQLCAALEDETAADGPHNGAFTGAFVSVGMQAIAKGAPLTWQQRLEIPGGLMAGQFAQHPRLNILGGGDVLRGITP